MEVLGFVDDHLDALMGVDRGERRRMNELSDEDREAEEAIRLKEVAHRIVSTAWARPLSDEEQQRWIERPFASDETPQQSLRRVVLLTLKSPQFLYLDQSSTDVDDFARARRMALALYDSLPDEKMLAAATAGELHSQQQLRDHAWRAVNNPRTHQKLNRFFHHWLEMDRAETASKDPDTFPGFDKYLIASLKRSLEMTIDDVVWSEASDYRQLLMSDQIFVDDRIANFYDIDLPQQQASPGTDSGVFHKVAFEPDRRSGLLTHPYLMMGLSYHRNTSPIHRGVFVAKSLLGRSLKPPPIDVEPLGEDFDPDMTTRQRVAHQTKEINCKSCHSIINPLGFSFENYDAVGRFRESEKEQPIDAAAVYLTPTGESIRLDGVGDLAKFLVSNPDAHRSFIEQLFQHIAHQPLAAYGVNRSDELAELFAAEHFSVKRLLVEMAVIVAEGPQ